MNPITLQNLIRHELIGLDVSVNSSSNPEYLGIRGKIMDETKNTLLIFDGVKRRMIPKDVVIFNLTLPDKSIVEVDGREIVGRPDERIKTVRRKQL